MALGLSDVFSEKLKARRYILRHSSVAQLLLLQSSTASTFTIFPDTSSEQMLDVHLQTNIQ